VLLQRILSGQFGLPDKVVVFSRDEAKQHALRMRYRMRQVATDELIYEDLHNRLRFRIGDVRDFHSVAEAVREADVIFNAAALKQVPTCEYYPYQAVLTNVLGPENIVRAIGELGLRAKTVIGISTDKACKPVNVMGMTKALQERLFLQANMRCPDCEFLCVRYGNVLSSRGSVIPLFHDQIRHHGPVTITHPAMTRFLMTLEEAVDTVFAAFCHGRPGEIYVPRVPSALVTDIAAALIGDRDVATETIGIRPGEKLHEILVSQEELPRTTSRDGYYVIGSLLGEVCDPGVSDQVLDDEYSSALSPLPADGVAALLRRHRLLVEDVDGATELLR
jgi:UDP-glucose 4-epimerase